jgi:nucleoside-diphosphate-sugar epimerase
MSKARVVAVSGASGYVGSIIAQAARSQGRVISLVRAPQTDEDISWSFSAADSEALTAALRERGVTDLVHAAWDMKANSMREMNATCVVGSVRLFDAARAAGVQRLIFISTISAFEQARAAYGRSKFLVEKSALDAGDLVIRLGLVYGGKAGGVFGEIQDVVRRFRVVPLIGSGMAPQYLLHEQTLSLVIKRALQGDFDGEMRPITIADPQPWQLREVVARVAVAESRKVILVPVPWRLLYLGVSTLERLGLNLNIRSDSVLSFIYQNEAPDFSALLKYDIRPAAFSDWPTLGIEGRALALRLKRDKTG